VTLRRSRRRDQTGAVRTSCGDECSRTELAHVPATFLDGGRDGDWVHSQIDWRAWNARAVRCGRHRVFLCRERRVRTDTNHLRRRWWRRLQSKLRGPMRRARWLRWNMRRYVCERNELSAADVSNLRNVRAELLWQMRRSRRMRRDVSTHMHHGGAGLPPTVVLSMRSMHGILYREVRWARWLRRHLSNYVRVR
jgi:hypothetical protein